MHGTEIYYIDSGAPYGKPIYTTVVIAHGFCINDGIFERLLPYTAKYGLRIIAVNSRDYAGSTPCTVEELSDYTSYDVSKQAAAVRRWGNEIGRFLAHVCRNIGIPRATGPANRQTGGLVLVTWSLSTMAGLSILGDPRTLGENLAAELSPYLRKIILYDPSALTAGANPNLLLTWPFADPLVPLAEKGERFNEWVSAYYTPHPDGAPITAVALSTGSHRPRNRSRQRMTCIHMRSGIIRFCIDLAMLRHRLRDPSGLSHCAALDLVEHMNPVYGHG